MQEPEASIGEDRNPLPQQVLLTTTPTSQANFTLYVIGDKTIIVQDVLVRHGAVVLQAHGWTPFRARRSAIADRLASSINTDKPDILWIHLDSKQSYAQNPIHRSCMR